MTVLGYLFLFDLAVHASQQTVYHKNAVICTKRHDTEVPSALNLLFSQKSQKKYQDKRTSVPDFFNM